MVTDEGGCDIPRKETDYLLVGYYENADDEGLVDTVSFIEFRDHYQI